MARIWTEREAYRIPTTNTSNAGGTWNKCATISYAQGQGISCQGDSNQLISLDNMPVKNYYPVYLLVPASYAGHVTSIKGSIYDVIGTFHLNLGASEYRYFGTVGSNTGYYYPLGFVVTTTYPNTTFGGATMYFNDRSSISVSSCTCKRYTLDGIPSYMIYYNI